MLDMPTIIIATYCTAIVQGCLLLFFWLQDRRPLALGLAGGAFVFLGSGFALMGARHLFGLELTVCLGGAAILLSGALFLAAARRLGGRDASWGFVLTPSVLWAVACAWSPFMSNSSLRASILSSVMAACFLACALESRRWPDDGLLPRRTLCAIALVFCLLFVARAIFNGQLPFPLGSGPAAEGFWPALLSLTVFGLLSMVAFLAVGMTHGPCAPGAEFPAIVDPETGALRRGAFLVQGARMVARHHEQGRQACLALVAVAPAASGEGGELRTFARVAGDMLKPTDMFARMGETTFVVLLADATTGECEDFATALCERYAQMSAVAGHPAMMRAGIASSTQAGGDLRAMIIAAERALKRARFASSPVVQYHPALAPREAGRMRYTA